MTQRFVGSSCPVLPQFTLIIILRSGKLPQNIGHTLQVFSGIARGKAYAVTIFSGPRAYKLMHRTIEEAYGVF